MTTLSDLDTYVRSQKARRKRKSTANEGANGNEKTARAQSAVSRSRALSTLAGRRVLALSRPLDYEIPGAVSAVRQPSGMACWATTYTTMVAWRDQQSMSIEATLGQIGQKWIDLFKADNGSSAEQEAELWAASGLVAEPLASYTLESWEGMLREYGPLAVIVDVDPSDKRAMHVVMVTGIHGDGSADGTSATLVDPARGDKRPVKFSAFLGQYEQGAERRTASGRHNQIIHWPKDVKFAGAKGFGEPARAPAQSALQPWSRYFQFRKGSTFEVDGPLSYNGQGEVLDRTADYLKFAMKMPAVSIFGQQIPAADMVFEATYKQEGKGNLVRATLNGVVLEDAAAEIVSSGDKRTIRPKFTGGTAALPEWISVAPDGDDEIDLDMRIDGRDVDFDLKRTSGSSGMALGIDPWSRSFPFAGGTAFSVNGPLSFDGRGRVLERTDTFLKFELNMPAARILKIPKLDLVLEASYTKEGAGNNVDLTVNGTRHSDPNASITSDLGESRRTIIPSITIPGRKLEKISFAPDGRDQIDLDVTIDGKEHDFDLEKVKGPEAQAWVRGLSPTATVTYATPSAPTAQIVEQVRKELALRFTNPNDPGLHERRLRLRDLFSRVPGGDAKTLFDRLGLRPTRDDLSKRFHGTLATETRLELLGILRAIYEAQPSPAAPAVAPKPPLIWPTSALPPSESGRFNKALSKLEQLVKANPDPRNWRYQCWFEKLKQSDVDDRVIRWGLICPATSGAIGAAWVVGGCDISIGRRPSQDAIEKAIRSIPDVEAKADAVGIFTYLKAAIVVAEEMTSLPLENLHMLHDDVQRSIEKLREWADAPMGGSSAMPPAYISIKDWIGLRQDDPKSLYSCR